MGPEGLDPVRYSLQFSDKIPPSFDGFGDYEQYRENVLLWDAMTTVIPERRAPTIIGQLTGQAQVTAKTLPLTSLTSESGVANLLEELDRKFGLDQTTLLHNNISSFFDYTWESNMSVEEFVIGFHSRLDKISKLNLNDELKGHLLLRQANLDSHDRNIVVGSAGGDYSLQALATSLRNAYRREGLPASSMTSSLPSHNRSRPLITKNSKQNQAREPSNPRSPTLPAEDLLFFTHLSADKQADTPAAIIDSGASASVVGKETLDNALKHLGMTHLKDERIIHHEHQFGPSQKPCRTLCAVRVPFKCENIRTNQTITFNVRFDVIAGSLPFLIGLPSLTAMKASLNFHYGSLSLAINHNLYRLRLIRKSSHLMLPLCCIIDHQKGLRNDPQSPHRDDAGAKHHYVRPSRHYYIPSSSPSSTMHSDANQSAASALLSENDIRKLHEQLGHASGNQLEQFLKDAKKWDKTYHAMIQSVTKDCSCVLAKPPAPRPVCSIESRPTEVQKHISIDIVFFNRKPFLHSIDNCSKWSELGPLRSRRLKDQLDVLKRIQIYRHGIPSSIRSDQEFNKSLFLEFCRSHNIKLVAVAANHHEGNAIVERANRSIRAYVNRLLITEPQNTLIDIVAAATFFKNTSRGHQKSSSFELLYNRSPTLSSICNPLTHGSLQDNIAAARCRQLNAALNANRRVSPLYKVGESVFFWRDNIGWIGPATVVKVEKYALEVLHNNAIKTADIFRVRHAPSVNVNRHQDSNDEEAFDDGADQETSAAEPEITEPPTAPPTRIRRTEAQLLADETQRIISDLPPRRTPARNYIEISERQPQPLSHSQSQLSQEEKKVAYHQEKLAWVDNQAFQRINRNEVPIDANIIGSHVVYRRKIDGCPKARIVPWGHKDMDKNELRGDAPALSLDAMRIVISLAVERQWRIKKMDVKSAYLQAKGFDRDIYVRPPREEHDDTFFWKLAVPAYGLKDSGRLWFLTAYEALTCRFGLKKSKLDASLYFRAVDGEMLLLVVQVDDFLYAGTPALSSSFETFLKGQFSIGSLESDEFDIMGAHLKQSPSGTVTIDASNKLMAIEQIPINHNGPGPKDRDATPEELNAYRARIGKLLYVGRLASPVIGYHASEAATKCANLRTHHLRALNTTIKTLQKYPAVISFLPGGEHPFKLEGISDASMRESTNGSNVREGIIILRRSGDCVHAISWVSRLARRVARSTSTAELLAASDAVDRLTYLNHILIELGIHQTTELIVDSKSTFHLCSTYTEPTEVKNKIILASIREEHHASSMATMRWTPGQSHLADALTKDNQVIARQLINVLSEGIHQHPESSYTVTTTVPGPLALDESREVNSSTEPHRKRT